ncbi:ABC transporter substrate-binding protein [Agaribacterium sp. ZY112]|uniref:ABC transporter substrate-binding protein n=1 Tax=Agaribacterium sp. ZY112 TaxID=3233574 RepID=UPI003524973B
MRVNQYLKLTLNLIGVLLLSSSVLASSKAKILTIAFYADGDSHHGALRKLAREFEQENPSIHIRLTSYRTIENYSKQVDYWLYTDNGPELIFWYGGQRLKHYAEQGKLHQIDDMWAKHQLTNNFSLPSREASQINGHYYAIPITSYLWGLVYDEKALKTLDIQVPQTWQQLLQSCQKLRQQEVDMFSLGSQTTWVMHAWFDYLNLRVNGLNYHQKLLQGQIAYDDVGVIDTLKHWKQLLDYGCFNDNHSAFTRRQAFPRILHNMSLMSLADGPTHQIPEQKRQGLRIASFPQIHKNIPQYTVAPVNVFILPSHTEKSAELDKLVEFISSIQFQSEFNNIINRPAAHIHATAEDNIIIKQMQDTLRSSPGGIQYLDRDTDIRFGERSPYIFENFMRHQDVKRCAKELEQLRQHVFGPL